MVGCCFLLTGLFVSWLCGVFLAGVGFALGAMSGGSSLVVAGLLTAMTSLAVGHGLSCSEACGIFPEQGLNPHALH